MWQLIIAELTVSAIFIGLLVRALRRYERHLVAVESSLDHFRDEVRASMRAQVDQAIAEMVATNAAPVTLFGMNGDVHHAEFAAPITITSP